MNEEQREKLEKAKKLRIEQSGKGESNAKIELHMFGTDDVKMIHDKFLLLHEELSEIIKNQELDRPTVKDLEAMKEEFAALAETLRNGIVVKNQPDKVTVENLKDFKFPEIKAPAPVVKVLREEDLFATFKAADSDQKDSSESYYGFVNNDGKWFIMRELGKDNKSWRYATGKVSYNKGWSERRKLTYLYFYELSI